MPATIAESTHEIAKRWKAEGRTFTIREVTAEWERQSCALARAHEDELLTAAGRARATDHVREVAQQIRDHRHNDDGHAMACPRQH